MVLDVPKLRAALGTLTLPSQVEQLKVLQAQAEAIKRARQQMLEAARRAAAPFTLTVQICPAEEGDPLSRPGKRRRSTRLSEFETPQEDPRGGAEPVGESAAPGPGPDDWQPVDYQFEACPDDTIASVLGGVAQELQLRAGWTLWLHDRALPLGATLESLKITESSILQLGSPEHRTCRGFEIRVRTLTGKHVPLKARGADTIGHIKALVQEAEGVPCDQQCLVFGQKLDDGRTLSSYGIRAGATVNLVLRLRGGMYDETSGRSDYEVVGDGVFICGRSERVVRPVDGVYTLIGPNGGAELTSQRDVVEFLARKHLDRLFEELASTQEESERIAREVTEWVRRAPAGALAHFPREAGSRRGPP